MCLKKLIVKQQMYSALSFSFYFWTLFSFYSPPLWFHCFYSFSLIFSLIHLLSFSLFISIVHSPLCQIWLSFFCSRHNGETAEGPHRQQVTSSPAYVKRWRGAMVTEPYKAREDRLILMGSWREQLVSRLKKLLWRLTGTKILIILWVAIKAIGRQRKQR